jgi:hypothetical protein
MRSQPIRLSLSLSFFLAFCGFVCSQDKPPDTSANVLEIKNVRLVASQVEDKEKHVEVHELLETKPLRLIPSNRFDVECEIVGGKDAGDYLVWTSVDFLVAPVTRAYEKMDNKTLSSSVGWGQVTEMLDLKATPIYSLRPRESRKATVKGLNLSPVLAAFPVGEDGELWPWLIRIVIHLQDRSGKQLTAAERTLRLIPNSARKKSHYNDALPSR